MKTMLRILLLLVCFSFASATARGGTDPTNEPSVFQINSIHLDPDTFIVTLVINTPRADLVYGVLAHDGPSASNATWSVIGEQYGSGSTATFLDDVSGSLTHTGRSYRGFTSLTPGAPPAQRILTANEEFIAYPFLDEPTLRVDPISLTTNRLVITYGESIYTNSKTWNIPGAASSAIFRVYSFDGDPSNSVIQTREQLQSGSWSNIPEL